MKRNVHDDNQRVTILDGNLKTRQFGLLNHIAECLWQNGISFNYSSKEIPVTKLGG